MTDVEKVVGVVNAVSEERHGIRIGEAWYNAEKKCEAYVKDALKGQKVELTLSEGNKFSFIKAIAEETAAPQKAAPKLANAQSGPDWDKKDRQSTRQTCINAAARVVAALVTANKQIQDENLMPMTLKPIETLFGIAKEMEAWINRP